MLLALQQLAFSIFFDTDINKSYLYAGIFGANLAVITRLKAEATQSEIASLPLVARNDKWVKGGSFGPKTFNFQQFPILKAQNVRGYGR